MIIFYVLLNFINSKEYLKYNTTLVLSLVMYTTFTSFWLKTLEYMRKKEIPSQPYVYTHTITYFAL